MIRPRLALLMQIAKNLVMAVPALRQRARSSDPAGARSAIDKLLRGVPLSGARFVELDPRWGRTVVDHALAAGASSAESVRVDERVVPLPDASADVIFANDVFEHLHHPDAVLAECHRVLRIGGRLVMQVDLRDFYEAETSRGADHLAYPTWLWNAMTWYRPAYTNRLRYADWQRLLAASQLELVAIEPSTSALLEAEYATGRFPPPLTRQDVTTASFVATLRKTR